MKISRRVLLVLPVVLAAPTTGGSYVENGFVKQPLTYGRYRVVSPGSQTQRWVLKRVA